MKRHTQHCPIAGMLNIVGDRWTWLVIREAFYGASRFHEFERNTGIAKNLLADRLALLVDEGVFEKRDIGDRGTRYAYELTDKGKAMQPVLIAMLQWSNDHIYGAGRELVQVVERKTNKPLQKFQPTTKSGKRLAWSDLAITPGPAASKAVRKRLSQIPTEAGGPQQRKHAS